LGGILSVSSPTERTTMSDGRYYDILELKRALSHSSGKERDTILKSIDMIKQESGSIRSMRERLIRAHREGDKEEIKDIHDYVQSHSKYQNG
jgi:hypothetical protein